MKTIWKILVGLVGVLVAIALIGILLPKQHIATYTHHFDRAPEDIWQVITEVRLYPQWKPDTRYVKVIEEQDGAPQLWLESDLHDVETGYRVKNSLEPFTWEIVVDHPEIASGGTWLFALEPNGEGTDVSITETASVNNPLKRFIDRFVVGYTLGIKDYMKALESRLNTTPVKIE